MGHPSTLYRFKIDLSDVDGGRYETLDFRIAMHPSETTQFLLTRVFAFALNTREGLEFAPGGLSEPDEPCIAASNPNGGYSIWIEVGNPSPKKLHKAAKAARVVKVYTYKNAEPWLRDVANERVHRADEIEIYSLAPEFLDRIAGLLGRDNDWSVLHTDGTITVSSGNRSEQGELTRHQLQK